MSEKKSKMDREKIIKDVKIGGDILMYVGSAGLVKPHIQKAKENENGLLGSCSTGAGIILSAALGSVASGVFNKVVDKVVDFWDDVKPKEETEIEEESE